MDDNTKQSPTSFEDYYNKLGPDTSFQNTGTETSMQPPAAMPSTTAPAAPTSFADYYKNLEYKDPLTASEQDDGSFLADLGWNVAAGGAELLDSAGWLLDVTGFDGAAESVHGWADKAIDYFDNQMSDESKKELQKEFFKIKEDGSMWKPWTWERPEDAAGWKTALLQASRSIPATAVGMGGGALAARGVFKAAGFLNKTYGSKKGVDALLKAAEAGKKAKALGAGATDEIVVAGARAEKYLDFMSKTSGAIGGGLGEGAVGGMSVGNQVKNQIMDMSHEQLMESDRYREVFDATKMDEMGAELPFTERVRIAREIIADQASTKAALETGMFTAILGAPIEAAFAPIFTGTQVAKAFANGRFQGLLKGAALETMQEMGQSGVEQYVQNLIVGELDPNVKPWDGVFNSIISGGIAGGLMGGTVGGVFTKSKKAAARDEAMQANQDKLEMDNFAVSVVAKNTMDNLMEKHGMSEEKAKQHVVAALERFAADRNKIKAITDLRWLSFEGKPRDPEQQYDGPVDDYLDGHPITIEVQAGETRESTGIQHTAAYGEFDGTLGADGDPIDVFVGESGSNAYIIEKTNPDGSFQQHKVMLGYATAEDAINSFYEHSDPNTMGSIAQVLPKELSQWLKETTQYYEARGVDMQGKERLDLNQEPVGVLTEEGTVEPLPEEPAATEQPIEQPQKKSKKTTKKKAAKKKSEEKAEPEGPQLYSLSPEQTEILDKVNRKEVRGLPEEERKAALQQFGLKPNKWNMDQGGWTETAIRDKANEMENRDALFNPQGASPPAARESKLKNGLPSVDLNITHQSTTGDLKTIQKAYYGTHGSQSRTTERGRVESAQDERIKQRVFFNSRVADDANWGEQMAGAEHMYTGTVTGLYDLNADPKGIYEKYGNDPNKMDSKLLDLGYKGVFNTMGATGPLQKNFKGGRGYLFNDMPVNYQGTKEGLGGRLLEDPTERGRLPTGETIYGSKSDWGPAVKALTPEQRKAFHAEQRLILTNQNRRVDLLAEKLGAKNKLLTESTGAYEGGLNPVMLVNLDTAEQADAYALAVKYIYKQDAVPWMRALEPTDEHVGVRGAVLTYEGGWTPENLEYLVAELGDDIGFTLAAPDKVIVGNYGEAADFEDIIDSAASAFGDGNVIITSVDIEGNYHDEENTEQALEVALRAVGQSDILAWIHDRASESEERAAAFFEGLQDNPEAVTAYRTVAAKRAAAKQLSEYRSWNMSQINEDRAFFNEQVNEILYPEEVAQMLANPKMNALLEKHLLNFSAFGAGAYTKEQLADAIAQFKYLGTESRYFKRWFGKSKVVDSGGNPIVMYHSSRKDFSGKEGVRNPQLVKYTIGRRGFLSFSPSRDYVVKHQKLRWSNTDAGVPTEGEEFNVYAAYIKAERVFDFREEKQTRSLIRYLEKNNLDTALLKTGTDRLQSYMDARAGKETRPVTVGTLRNELASGNFAFLEDPVVINFLKERNYDGFYITQEKNINLNVFRAEGNIKSARAGGNTRVYDSTIPFMNYSLTAPDTNEVFFSALENWISTGMPAQAKKKEIINWFTDKNSLAKKQIKREEAEDIGLFEWVQDFPKDTITKQDMLEFVRTNKLNLVEIEYRNGPNFMISTRFGASDLVERQTRYMEEWIKSALYSNNGDMGFDEVDLLMDEYRAKGLDALSEYLPPSYLAELDYNLGLAKMDQWQAEVLAQPDIDPDTTDQIGVYQHKYDRWTMTGATNTYREFLMRLPVPKWNAKGEYQSKHWDQSNVLVHLRFSSQFDPVAGQSTLFVEEVQSDWHQQGQRYGYGEKQNRFGVAPEAPFKENWKMLGMKRLIRYAAENGYDKVAWVTGEEQTKRYDIKDSVGMLRLSKDGKDGENQFYTVSWGLSSTGGPETSKNNMTEWQVADMIGQETADKLIAKMGEGDTAELRGPEVSWDGRGLKNFYNNTLKKAVRTYIKKWGSDVTLQKHYVRGFNSMPAAHDLWTFPVTDAMRESVLKGQPLYSLAGNSFEELNRMLETMQLKHFLTENTKEGIKPKVLKARIIDGMERGLFSKDIVRATRLLSKEALASRSAALLRVEQNMAYNPILNLTNERISKYVAEQEVRRIISTWDNPPDFEVVADWRGLPDYIRRDVYNHKLEDRVEGTIDRLDGNKVYIVAGNLATLDRLGKVFAEEALGHHGVRAFFGSEKLNEFLDEIMPSIEGSAGWNRLLATSYRHLEAPIRKGDMDAKRTLAEELFVKQDVEQTVLQKFFAWIRAQLRRMGLITAYTDNDLRRILARVHSNIIGGHTPLVGGRRNGHRAQYRVGNQLYSLYGQTLQSKLEETLGTLQDKDTPYNYLIRLKGNNEDSLWSVNNEISKQAAGKLGFSEKELDLCGLIPWLVEKHRLEPKMKVTKEEMIRVFRRTKPRIMTISRGGEYRFPTEPLSRMLEVSNVETTTNFDMAKALEYAGFFSKKLKDTMNDKQQVVLKELVRNRLRYYGNDESELEGDKMVTPRMMIENRLINPVFNRNPTGTDNEEVNVPPISELEAHGYTSKQIGALIGVKDLDAPVTWTNSNAQMRAAVSKKIIANIRDERGFVSTQYRAHLSIEGWYDKYKNFLTFSTVTDENGSPLTFESSDPTLNDSIAARIDAIRQRNIETLNFKGERNRLFDASEDANEPTLLEGPLNKIVNIDDLVREEVTKHLAKIAEEIEEGPIESMEQAKEVYDRYGPEVGEFFYKIMDGTVSFSGRTTDVRSPYGNYRSDELYARWTLDGGDKLDVISVQLIDTPHGKNREPAGGAGNGDWHYDSNLAKDVVHFRVKTRKSPSGGKVFAIEEVQSDWASNYRKAPIKADQAQNFTELHMDSIIELMRFAYSRFDWGGWADIRRVMEKISLDVPKQDIVDAINYYNDGWFLQYLMKTSFGSKTFGRTLEKLGTPELNEKYKKIVAGYHKLEPKWNEFPWMTNYFELALRAAVGFALENDYEAVAWPEGSEVAQLYSGHMAEKMINGYVDFTQQKFVASSFAVPSGMAWDSNVADNIRRRAREAGHGGFYNLDYLDEMIGEGGPNAEVAQRLKGYYDEYIDKIADGNFEVNLQDIIQNDDNIYADETGLVFFRLPEERLYNGRLHKLLYNSLLPQAAKRIANDTKAMIKAGETSTGLIFMEDAYNARRRGSRRGRGGTDQSEDTYYNNGHNFPDIGNRAGSPEYAGGFNRINLKRAVNQYTSSSLHLLAHDTQLFGRDGGLLREMQRQLVDGSYGPWDDDTFTSYVLGSYYPRTGTHFQVTEAEMEIIRAFDNSIDQNARLDVRPVNVAMIGATDGDNTGPYDHLYEFENAQTGQFLGSMVMTDGDGESYPFYQRSESYHTASFLNFVHNIMQDVWGIENPNPFSLPVNVLRQLKEQVFARGLMSVHGGGTNAMAEALADYDAAREESKAEFFDFQAENDNYMPWDEPADYQPVMKAPIDNMQRIGLPVILREDSQFLNWAKENATVKNKFDAAMVMALLRANNTEVQDQMRLQQLRTMYPNLPDPELTEAALLRLAEEEGLALGDRSNWEEQIRLQAKEAMLNIIPTNYKNPQDVNKMPEQEAADAAPEPPKFGIENPEFIEQVWHAIYMTERVRNKPLYMNFSLRGPAGNESELSIINTKISKADSSLTVLDRVTNWIGGLRQSIQSGDLLWSMKQGLLDDTAAVERWERMIMGNVQDASISAHKMMHMTRNLPSVMAAIGKAGIPDMIDGAFQPVDGRKGFIDIFRPLYENQEGDLLDLWQGYAAARRSAELILQTNPDGTSREKLFTQDEIVELLALGDKYPIFKTVFEDWKRFNNDLLNLAVKQGVLSEQQRDLWSQNDYVPFFRALDSIEGVGLPAGMGMIKSGISGQHHRIKRLRGSDKPLGNIIENMWFNTASLIDKIYKNEAMTRVVDMLDGICMNKAKIPFEAIRLTNQELANALGRAGLIVGDHKTRAAKAKKRQIGSDFGDTGWLAVVEQMTTEQKLQWSTVFRPSKPVGDDIVSVMRNGKLVYYKVEDPHLLSTLHGMTASGMTGLMKAMGLSKSILTKMITIDPSFMMANWMRDTLSAWVTSDANFVPVADSIRAMKDVFTESGDYLKMMMSGAGGGGFYDMTGGNMTRVLNQEMSRGAKTWLPKVWRGYMKIGAASENSNRLAIAQRVMRNGGTVAEAMHQAQDIMNFTMSGDYAAIRFLIRTVPFMNARLQGLYRLGRGIRDYPVGFMMKGMALTAATLALLAKNWDDDDYERLPEWSKDIGWNFFVNGVHYQIPKPFEVGLIFGTFPERLVRYMAGHDKLEISAQRFLAAFGSTLAFNPIPQLFMPLYEEGANKVLFTGSPIVNMAMSGMEYPYQYTPWTSEVAKAIGGMMPDWSGPAQSPLRIEHIIRAYTGTVGLYTLNAVDWAIRQVRSDVPERPATKWYELPVIRRVIKGESIESHWNKYSDRIYDAIDESDKAFRTINSLRQLGKTEEAKALYQKRRNLLGEMTFKKDGTPVFANRTHLNAVRQDLREIAAKQRAIAAHPTMSGEQKRELLDALNVKRNQILDKVGPLLDLVEE